jgi:hypothetical protein
MYANPPGPIPDNTRRYIAANVPSVPYLEAALLLRAEPHSVWNAAGLSARLYVTERIAAALLQELRAAGLAEPAEQEGMVVYTRDESLAATLDAVAQAYATHLLEVTQLIHGNLDRRAHIFADAFRLKKD